MRMSRRYAELLGEFDLQSGVKIYLDAHDDAAHLDETHTHESSHRKLASSTIFGQIQLLLAIALKKGAGKRIPWFRAADVTLNLVLDASWAVDEGYATFMEINSRKMFNSHPLMTRLPDEYAQAYANITSPLRTLPDSFAGFECLVVRALAEAAMNITILDLVPFDDRFAENVVSALHSPLNCPDQRLTLLTAALSHTPFDPSLGNWINEEVHACARKHKIEENVPASELFMSAAARATLANLDFLQEIDDRLTPRLEQALAVICPEVKFLSAEETYQSRIRYNAQAQAYGIRYGLTIPDYRRGSHAELAVMRAEEEYETFSPLQTVHVPDPEMADVVAKLLATHYESFLITVAPALDGVPGEPWVCLSIAPLHRRPSASVESDEWQFQGKRVLLYAPVTYGQRWCEQFRAHKATVLLLHFMALNEETWTISRELRVLDPLPVCVLPYNGRRMLGVLTQWKELGVQAMIPLLVINDRLLYVLVRLSTGVDIIARFPLYLFGIMKVHYPEISEFVSRSFGLKWERLPPVAFLEMLIKADLAGSFLPLRDADAAIFVDEEGLPVCLKTLEDEAR